MSETSEEPQPRRFQLAAPFAQFRVRNSLPAHPMMRGAWIARQAKRGGILDSEVVHPADLEHLLQVTFEVGKLVTDKFGAKTLVKEKFPMLVELPEAAKEAR